MSGSEVPVLLGWSLLSLSGGVFLQLPLPSITLPSWLLLLLTWPPGFLAGWCHLLCLVQKFLNWGARIQDLRIQKGDFPGGPAWSALPLQGARVQSLIGELRLPHPVQHSQKRKRILEESVNLKKNKIYFFFTHLQLKFSSSFIDVDNRPQW